MEAVEEPPLHNAPVDGMKITVIFDESDENAVASVASDVCHKSNGVAEASESAEVAPTVTNTEPIEAGKSESVTTADMLKEESNDVIDEPQVPSTPEADTATDSTVESVTKENADKVTVDNSSLNVTELSKTQVEDTEKNCSSNTQSVESVEVDNVAISTERVTFQTEILVETNDTDVIETVTEETIIGEQDTSNLLSELGQSIELSEALRSSDVTDNAENNNCTARREVFNKEELLDILEGNDQEQPENILATGFEGLSNEKILETQLALEQLSRLKKKPKRARNVDRLSRNRRTDKNVIKQDQLQDSSQAQNDTPESKNDKNIVNVLVKEWDDEEASDVDKSSKLLEDSENLIKSTNEVIKSQEGVTKEEDQALARTSIHSSTEGKVQVSNKSSDEGQPQRRLGRVIKKKVIFDPDNPDTFTKSKSLIKSKEPSQEKDETPSKKIKTEQTFSRSKSKSPMSKLQWKKPSPKSCKQNKRLTEIDRLLMDEGAVNMIYQLTPEAPKGKKNMKTKAEFIKKIQSSTPDSKEMKFRERKKESRYEEGEARRILGGKQRPSLSSSVKSPSVSEDFEAHSADDSIIYRRHSSSSYSSSCMSPRRLSDVEMNSQSVSRTTQQSADRQHHPRSEGNSNRPLADVFMSDSTDVIKTDTINKDDCLSIKEKLNSKLNLALNKRKHDNPKADKSLQLKKVKKSDEKHIINSGDFKHLLISFDQRLAEICVLKPGSKCSIEVIKELEKALIFIESKKDTSVTLLTSECGNTYSDLDLRPLLDKNMENATNFAYEMAESIRSLFNAMVQHSKLLCLGMSGRCSGIGLALIGLSDVALISERSTFVISAKSHASAAPIEPGVSVLTTCRLLPQPLLNDLVVFGRRLSASEALQSGLVSRVLWPENFNEQVHTIAKEVAAQPAQNIWLKKQLLNMKRSGSESTFLSYFEKERDLLVEYWTSVEGHELLRATYNSA